MRRRKRQPDLDRMRRWTNTATTWFQKAVAWLSLEAFEASDDDARWLVGYDAERLLSSVLLDAQTLVAMLNEEQLADVRARARKLAGAIRDRELSLKLARVDGRTPEEAEAFRAKATELAGRIG